MLGEYGACETKVEFARDSYLGSLAINNQIDRFSLAIGVIDRAPKLQVAGACVKEKMRDMLSSVVNTPTNMELINRNFRTGSGPIDWKD